MNSWEGTGAEPGHDCPLCPRLVAFREEWRAKEPTWRNAPVPAFGGPEARLLIVGLAPGLRGANRTGRPFTGDYAGDLLYRTMLDFGFASGTYEARADDGSASAVTPTVMMVARAKPAKPHNLDLPQNRFGSVACHSRGKLADFLGGH